MAWAGEGEAGEVDKGRERGSRNRGGGLMMRWVDVYVLRGKAEGWGGWRLEGGEREEGGGAVSATNDRPGPLIQIIVGLLWRHCGPLSSHPQLPHYGPSPHQTPREGMKREV